MLQAWPSTGRAVARIDSRGACYLSRSLLRIAYATYYGLLCLLLLAILTTHYTHYERAPDQGPRGPGPLLLLTILTKVHEDPARSDGELGRIKTVLELHCQLLYRTFAHYAIGPNSGTGSGEGFGHTAMWNQAAFLSFCEECEITDEITLEIDLASSPKSDRRVTSDRTRPLPRQRPLFIHSTSTIHPQPVTCAYCTCTCTCACGTQARQLQPRLSFPPRDARRAQDGPGSSSAC